MLKNVGKLNVRIGLKRRFASNTHDARGRLYIRDFIDVFLAVKCRKEFAVGTTEIQHGSFIEIDFALQPRGERFDSVETGFSMTANAIRDSSIRRLVMTTLFVVGIGTVVFVKTTNRFIRERELCLDERAVKAGLEFDCDGLGMNSCNEALDDTCEILY